MLRIAGCTFVLFVAKGKKFCYDVPYVYTYVRLRVRMCVGMAEIVWLESACLELRASSLWENDCCNFSVSVFVVCEMRHVFSVGCKYEGRRQQQQPKTVLYPL